MNDALAKQIGVTRRTIIYRENGGKITKQAEIAIRSLAADKLNKPTNLI
jgi:DNA-binding XRE family transcriptional regulator